MRVGSLFAGIGGFDLGFERAGFDVAWCVEWDKHAQAVLRRRFPNAQVYGDIREVDPAQLAPVDVICGGFPCQDLSVAGKRAGLAGERSGLFYDAMRIVRAVRPRLLVLENVPGLLSSNNGLDFAAVLREVGEGWDCAEVGWRVLDSQYFGVAQRRRRVFVVASSRIGCSEEVLALAEGSGGNPPSRGKAREVVADDAARCVDVGCWWEGGDCAATLTKQNANGAQRMPDKGNLGAVLQPFSPHGHYRYEASDQSATLQDRENRMGGHTHLIAMPIQDGCRANKDQKGMGIGGDGDPSYALDTTGAQSVFTIDMQAYKRNANVGTDVSPTLCRPSGSDAHVVAFTAGSYGGYHEGVGTLCARSPLQGGGGETILAFRKSKRAQSATDDETWVDDDLANTLNGFDTGDTRTSHAVAFHPTQDPISSNEITHSLGTGNRQGCATVAVAFKTGNSAQSRSDGLAVEQSPTLGSNAGGNTVPGVCHQMVVRRLTPLECERLQGFPDGWTQIGSAEKPTADSHRYKQLGNAVTVNVAEWIGRRAFVWLMK